MSPTQRSLKLVRDADWLAEIVEKRNPVTRTLNDLFGIGDIVAIKDNCKPLLIQTTSGSNINARQDKILANPNLDVVRKTFHIQCHGWRKLKLRPGAKAVRWVPIIRILSPTNEWINVADQTILFPKEERHAESVRKSNSRLQSNP